MERLPRRITSWIVGAAAVLSAYVFLFPSGCDAVDGVPSWVACRPLAGLPAFSLEDWGINHFFDILIPLAVGLLAGTTTWWFLRSADSDSTYRHI